MSPTHPSFETLAEVLLRIVPAGALLATRYETTGSMMSYVGTNFVRFIVIISDKKPDCVRYDLTVPILAQWALERIERFRGLWTAGELYDLLTEFEADTKKKE